MKKIIIIFALLLIVVLGLKVFPKIALRTQSATLPVEFLCNLVGADARAIGIAGTDLGIGFIRNNSLLLFFGDVNGGPDNKNIAASAVAIAPKSDTPACADFIWSKFQPLKSAKQIGTDISTVPSGVIQIGDAVYIFAMRMMNWDFLNKKGNHGYGMLFKSKGSDNFQSTHTLWAKDSLHMNTAPVLGTLPDGAPVVYLYLTGEYRKSSIYLAYVAPDQIENKEAYHYYPDWTTTINRARPLINARAGELSAVYNPTLKQYLLMFSNYSLSNGGLKLYTADQPQGPFTEYTLDPCAKNADWLQAGWGGCYGGYIIPETFGPDGRDIYFTLSLWRPYTVVLMKTRL
ncbi:DUF4185 domain-containing protein [Candidatus Falkowbacteria bacterium]|nr:DUF4185 domain-containing protein [Candidatus Falkowbacteria bacterium]